MWEEAMLSGERRVRILHKFKGELDGRLSSIEAGLHELEEQPASRKSVDLVMRESHTIKGAARMLSLPYINAIAEKMENLFELLHSQGHDFQTNMAKPCRAALDQMAKLINAAVLQEPQERFSNEVQNLCKEFDKVLLGERSSQTDTPPPFAMPATQSSSAELEAVTGPLDLEALTPTPLSEKNRSPVKILIVEDSALQREMIRQAVAARGYEVITADSGLAGIASAFEERPDLIVCDVVMPEISGYHLCRFIKNEKGLDDIPTVLMTSSAVSKQDRFWGMKSGAAAYITKSQDMTPLLQVVQLLLSKRGVRPAKRRSRGDTARENINSTLNYLFDKLLFETTLSNEVRGMGERVYARVELLAEFARLIDSLVEFVALGISIFGRVTTETTVHCLRRLGPAGLQAIQRALAARPNPASDTDAKVLFVPEELYDPSHLELDEPRCFSFDLVAQGELIGLVTLVSVDNPIDEGTQGNIRLAVREFSAVLRTHVYYEETRRLSISDGLTGLFNHRHFVTQVEAEFGRFLRYGSVFSLVMMDLDGFKQINDFHGHQAGDTLLRGVSKVMQRCVRNVDLLARYGGDEFVCLLPETGEDGANVVGERIRGAIAGFAAQTVGGLALKVTASVGVCTVSPQCSQFSDVIGAADRALYLSKEAGRNRVTIFRFESDDAHRPVTG